MNYSSQVIEVRRTAVFDVWLTRLRDATARAQIVARLRRLSHGNFGDTKPIGDGLNELRIHSGPGYRLYFVRRGSEIIVLLCAGDKSSQSRDIAKAKELAKEV